MEWPGKLSNDQMDILLREMHSDIKEIKEVVYLVPAVRKEGKIHRWLIGTLWAAIISIVVKGLS